jgi:hypothetical protein
MTMSVPRLFALVLIFALVSAAWMMLGGSLWVRTEMLDRSSSREIESLWGPRVLAQAGPFVAPRASDDHAAPNAADPRTGDIHARVRHQYRYRGLLWYSMFTVSFEAQYTVSAADAGGADGRAHFIFPLPQDVTSYDELSVAVDGDAAPVLQKHINAGRLTVPLDGDANRTVSVSYVARGREVWVYAPSGPPEQRYGDRGTVLTPDGPLRRLRNFRLEITTSFAEIDYPKGTASPTPRPAEKTDGGMRARWAYANALTNQAMGVVVPERPNAGPIVARMSFFAPVSLLFFLAALFTVVVLKRIDLHPMHYLFVSAGFFAFHILMAYLADVIAVHAAFWSSAAVSVLLVVSYMRLVAGVRFAVLFVGLAQAVYLVGFSYAFFWVGRTGLTVTIGAVITLFVLMQATGRVKWSQVFGRRANGAAAPPPQAGGPAD